MALMECPECGKQVSTRAAACPHCGFPLSREVVTAEGPRRERGPSRWTDPGFWVIVVGLVTVIVLSLILLQHVDRGNGGETTVPASTTGALGVDEPEEGSVLGYLLPPR